MSSFRLMGLSALTLLLVGCYSLDDAFVLITNNSSEDIFYRYGVEGMEIDGKKIIDSMGTLKPQEAKEFTDIYCYRSLSGGGFWDFGFALTVDEAFYMISHHISEGETISIDISNTLLSELASYSLPYVGRPPFGLGVNIVKPLDSEKYNATNFYGFLTIVDGEERDDFYLLLDGVVYLADISERKLVKVE